MPSTLQRSDYEDCLILFYFGRGENKLSLCQQRAYEDFKRTLRGIRNLPRTREARRRADEALSQMLASIRALDASTQKDFDEWHRAACERLAAIYRQCGYLQFFVGHAQKWLNMTFKYIYVMGEQRLPGFSHLYDLCHVPLDNILMNELRSRGFPPLPCAWSKLNDYEEYLRCQLWVRTKFKEAPLDVEFRLWMHKSAPR
jgi:hypothetical protein